MIHVKTTTGEALINDGNVAIVEYDRENHSVLVVLNRQSSGGKHRYKIDNVVEFKLLPHCGTIVNPTIEH